MKSDLDLSKRAGLIHQWQRQIGQRLERDPTPRSVAVIKWSSRFHPVSPLIDLQTLRATVMYDVNIPGECPRIRIAGYWCRPIDEGVAIGGTDGIRFEKNLALAPRCRGRGPRMDSGDVRLLREALVMDARLSTACVSKTRFPIRLRLPALWAGFSPSIADSIQGSGPELCGLCHSRGESSAELLTRFRRSHKELVLFPHEWVSGFWHKADAIFADFAGIPRCQILDCSGGIAELSGYRAACEFDFVSTRFSVTRRSRSRSTRELSVAG